MEKKREGGSELTSNENLSNDKLQGQNKEWIAICTMWYRDAIITPWMSCISYVHFVEVGWSEVRQETDKPRLVEIALVMIETSQSTM